ncbi:hypothetical protein GVN24_23765 [Rhizobium sp. CRIBSB]|nr:hypothetical protein [Rhizobium sp. CRIBSB]
MTDPTPVDEIVVVGQRRLPGGTFPARGGGGPGDSGGDQQIEVTDDPGQPTPPPDPCANPETAVPWNADAKAAASAADFLAHAATLGGADAPNGLARLSNREFGRGLARGPGGSVSGNAVSHGPPLVPGSGVASITINMDGITPYNYIGDVHSHPFGTTRPTELDWLSFMATNAQARDVGRTQETFYLYIITVDQNGNPSTIHVYQDGPRAANSPSPPRPTETGPEVNPDAQPCG